MSAGAGDRPRPLSRKILVRLRDLPRHFRALGDSLDTISAETYKRAVTSGGSDELRASVYAVERPFEIVDNYIAELARLGLEQLGLPTGDAPFNLHRLHAEGVISGALRQKLAEIHRVRNEAQHTYPDVRAGLVYEARAS